MALYPYQERVKNLILSGRSVILQAPTGAGKTRAALAPFIEAFFTQPPEEFPRKCIYSVPMRVLANQFVEEYQKYAAEYNRKFRKELAVKIQTGEHADDPRFRGNLIFATIDQSLSSALAVPYSVGSRLANINAGAIFSSYLVFDEFHLFPVDESEGAQGALVTTLQLLTKLKDVVPFVLMTATFSSTMLQQLADELGAEVVQVPPEEYEKTASGDGQVPRSRTYHVVSNTIAADDVLDKHQNRSIVICNQVERAQNMFDTLSNHPDLGATKVVLLHSRFLAEDRKEKEEEIRREFGKDRALYSHKSMILVATQVVEVGVDITCENLHTEIAPANAIFQRAGRCARYPGERGHVYIYPVPERKRLYATDENAAEATKPNPDYLPYSAELSACSWQSFLSRDGEVLDFINEQSVIDEVHTDSDRQLIEAMRRQKGSIWDDIFAAMENSDPAFRQKLIRHVDSVKIVSSAATEDIGNPYLAQGFSLWRGSVKKVLRELEEYLLLWEGDEFEDRPWLMAYPMPVEKDPEDPTNKPEIHWLEIRDSTLIDSTNVVWVNNQFCAYDNERGFRIVPPAESNGWQSKPGEFGSGNRLSGYTYQLESYQEHIESMIRIANTDFMDEIAYVQRRLSERNLLPADELAKAVKLAIAGHDLGKLDKAWQTWVRLYQNAIGEPIHSNRYMAVHTHSVPSYPEHNEAKKMVDRQIKRPRHAGESAVALGRVAVELLNDRGLIKAVLTAIARHHSPSTEEFTPFALHPQSAHAFEDAIKSAGLPIPSKSLTLANSKGGPLTQILIEPKSFEQLILYLYIVRILRLCDGLSQERR